MAKKRTPSSPVAGRSDVERSREVCSPSVSDRRQEVNQARDPALYYGSLMRQLTNGAETPNPSSSKAQVESVLQSLLKYSGKSHSGYGSDENGTLAEFNSILRQSDIGQLPILSHGIDAAYSTFAVPLASWLLDHLTACQQEARRSPSGVCEVGLGFGGEILLLHASGGPKYRYRLSNDKAVCFLVGIGEEQPDVWVQPTAAYLHESGFEQALSDSRLFARECADGDIPLERANRLDLYVDILVGWHRIKEDSKAKTPPLIYVPHFPWTEAFIPEWGTDGTFRLYNMVTKATTFKPHGQRGKLSGFTVGSRKGDIYLRVYNKTQEMSEKGTGAYLPAIWSKHSLYKAHENDKPVVVRIEFEIKGSGLRSFLPAYSEELDDVMTRQLRRFVQNWSDVLPVVHAIWRYCLDWASVRIPEVANSTNRNRSRWPVAPWWSALGNLGMSNVDQVPVARVLQASCKEARLMSLVTGVFSSLGALYGFKNPEHTEDLLLQGIREKLQTNQTYWDKMEEKRKKWSSKLPTYVSPNPISAIEKAGAEQK